MAELAVSSVTNRRPDWFADKITPFLGKRLCASAGLSLLGQGIAAARQADVGKPPLGLACGVTAAIYNRTHKSGVVPGAGLRMAGTAQARAEVTALRSWFRNIFTAVWTVGAALWVTLRTWIRTYSARRKTFTEHYEYPELPLVVADRYRGFHRWDVTSCIACAACARDCPVDCIYIERERADGRKGFLATGFTIDYTKCLVCGLCVEACPTHCLEMGHTYNLSCYSRDGCLVDFCRLPLEIAWGKASLGPVAVAKSKQVTKPVYPTAG